MFDVSVNYLAVLLAAVASMVAGYVWYHPAVMGKTWMKLLGKSEADIKAQSKDMGRIYGLTFVAALVTAYVLAHFLILVGAVTLSEAVMTAIWAWLGFVATAMLTNSLFSGKPLQLWGIESGYVLVSMIVQAVVLTIVT